MNVDKSDMIRILRKFPSMLEEASSLGDDISFPRAFVDDILVAGMGGSGFSGDMLRAYLSDTPLRINVAKDYTLPAFVSRKSLVFAVSYSGNTEETISAYRSAVRRGCKVITLSSGGKLQQLAEMNKNPHIMIPKGYPPRLSTPYLFLSMLNVLSFSGMIDSQEKIIKQCSSNLESSKNRIEEDAKDLASKIGSRVPLIYSSQRISCVAEKWKTDINENAKRHAFYNVFPEFNHNEICAFDRPREGYYVVILSDVKDEEKIKKRVKVFKKLIAPNPVTEISFTGDNLMTRMLSSIWMGLFVSYYLAVDSGIDPTPVKIIENLKKEMAK